MGSSWLRHLELRKAFYSLLDEVENHSHSNLNQCPDCADKLAEAVSLYQGDFLQGLIV